MLEHKHQWTPFYNELGPVLLLAGRDIFCFPFWYDGTISDCLAGIEPWSYTLSNVYITTTPQRQH